MTLRRILFVFVILLLLILLRPRQVWAEFRRIQSQWDLILRLLVVVVIGYLLYGLYTIWDNGLL